MVENLQIRLANKKKETRRVADHTGSTISCIFVFISFLFVFFRLEGDAPWLLEGRWDGVCCNAWMIRTIRSSARRGMRCMVGYVVRFQLRTCGFLDDSCPAILLATRRHRGWTSFATLLPTHECLSLALLLLRII